MNPLVMKLAPYAVLVGLGLGAAGYLHHAGYESGRSKERDRIADSVSKVLDDSLKKLGLRTARVDTVVKRDTAAVARLTTQLLAWKDSAAHRGVDTSWKHDTAWISVPVRVVAEADSAIGACRSLVADCDSRDRLRLEQIGTITRKSNVWQYQAEHPPSHSCVLPVAAGAGAGGLAVGILAALIHR